MDMMQETKSSLASVPMGASQASSSCGVQDGDSTFKAGVSICSQQDPVCKGYSAAHFKSVIQTYIARLDLFFLPHFFLCFNGGEKKNPSHS